MSTDWRRTCLASEANSLASMAAQFCLTDSEFSEVDITKIELLKALSDGILIP